MTKNLFQGHVSAMFRPLFFMMEEQQTKQGIFIKKHVKPRVYDPPLAVMLYGTLNMF